MHSNSLQVIKRVNNWILSITSTFKQKKNSYNQLWQGVDISGLNNNKPSIHRVIIVYWIKPALGFIALHCG